MFYAVLDKPQISNFFKQVFCTLVFRGSKL